MARPFRVIDTGVRGGRRNIAFDQALIEGRLADSIPDTIRFLRFTPTALVGRHQDLSREIDLDHCRVNNVETARRITGGGAIYFDQGQLGWELVFRRRNIPMPSLADAARAICEAAAGGLSSLGIEARYRPRNDIEVDGRKLCGTGGFFEGDVLFYQGTLLIDMNPADMVAALRVPRAKLAKHELDDAGKRVVTLRQLLGDGLPGLETIQRALLEGLRDGLGIETAPGAVTDAEEGLAHVIETREIGRDDFIHAIDDPGASGGLVEATRVTPGGTVTAYVRLEGPGLDRVREVLITGDFFITPPRALFDLEASLRGVHAAGIGEAVGKFFEATPIDALTLSPGDFRDVLTDAVAGTAQPERATG